MGLLLDAHQVPVGMKLFPGNESEKPVIRTIIDDLKKRNRISGKTIQVADKGLNCAENILHAIKAGDGYRDVAVTYSLLNSLVTGLRADGLNPSAAIDAQQAEETLAGLKALGAETGYRMVPNSRTGTDLTAFSAEDLSFGGIRYTELSPETLPGEAEKELIDNEDGTWLMRCDGDGFEAVFTCDGDGGNAKILSYTILDPDAEGPRAVRLGDLMSDDYCRFRSEGNEMDEEMTEVLYGTEESGDFGLASFDYSAGEASLRYRTEADGTRVELLLKYEQNQLKEIILHTV